MTELYIYVGSRESGINISGVYMMDVGLRESVSPLAAQRLPEGTSPYNHFKDSLCVCVLLASV